MTSGEAVWYEDHFLPIHRNGSIEDVYWTFSYSPIFSKSNKIKGVLVTCNETTEKVKAVESLIESETEQVLARKKLEESQAQFNILADSILQMIWVTDPNGMHEYYNQRWYDFTGATVEQTAGEGWNEVFHPDDRQRAWKTWRHSLKTGELYEIEYRLRRKDGEYVWVLGRAAPLYDTDGHIVRWFGTCTDIHEQKKLQQQKEEFISIASHELRTPLTSLKASLQFLDMQIKREPNTNQMMLKMVGSANKHVNKLTTLVSDLLDVTKIEQGQLVLRKSVFSISDIINSCCETAVLSGIKIKTSGDLNTEVCADYVKIEQVLTNLINNSIKYAPASKQIEIHSEKTDQHLKISVRDFGPGIPAEKVPHLFGIYYRADTEGNQYSGLGLGLYISYRIISNHGGQIGVKSELGEGSTFWFTLPLR